MICQKLVIVLWVVAISGLARTGENLRRLHDQALSHYNQALAHMGLAMGEREDPSDPAIELLNLWVAELLCVKGDVEGCLAASREVGRRLGPYRELLGDDRLRPSAFAEGRKFLIELHQVSEGWGKDRSLASEALGLLEQLTGDHLLARARRAGVEEFNRHFERARSRDCPDPITPLLRAAELADLMLDPEKLGRVGLELVARLERRSGRQPGDLAALKSVLLRADAALRILGRAGQAEKVKKVAARLETKALTPPELSFELMPAAERFKCDLSRAHRQLLDLARRAPLRSRTSVILFYSSAHAGILAGSPRAVALLADIQETVSLTDPYLAVRVRGLRGRGALLAGDFFSAGRLLSQAAGKLSGHKNSARLKGLLLANAAQARFYLGAYQKSAATYLEAAAQFTEAEYKGQAHLGAAHALTFARQPERAGPHLDKAEKLLAGLPDNIRGRHLRALSIDRALWLLSRDEADEAVALFEQVAEEARKATDLRAGVIARTNLAELYNDKGRPGRALTQAESALKWLNQDQQADAAWQAWCEKGRALAALGKSRAAAESFARAMRLVERLRAMIGAEGSRRSFAAAKTRLYQAAVALQIASKNHQEAFRISERARSRAFLDMLQERRLSLGDRGQQAYFGPARERMLGELPPLKLSFGGPGANLSGRPAAKDAAPYELRPDPRNSWHSLVTVNPATVSDVRRYLGRRESLVSFFHDGKQLHAFVIGKAGIRVHSVEIGEGELGSRIHGFMRVLQKPHRGDRRLRKKSERLYKLFFEPVMKSKFKKLSVVPWGPLHYLPFMALFDGERYLVDRIDELVAVPSASVFVMLRAKAGKKPGQVLALGNPVSDMPSLPSAAREVKIVKRLFGSAEVHTGPRASKSVFVKSAPAAGLIHVASHGVFLPERPMDSYLALSGDKPQDGRLSAREILQLDLSRAGLVVLSACDTGRAQIQKGDEIIGLTRAFLHAGANSLVASLWPLSDEAAEGIVGSFYRGINQGKSPAASLTQSVRALKKNPKFSHPFFWAPFELIGT